MYVCQLPVIGGSIVFTGPRESWMRIDVLAFAGRRVCLGFAGSEAYQPHGEGGHCVRLGGWCVQALDYSGLQVQLGIDIPPGFSVEQSNQIQPVEIPAELSALVAQTPATGNQAQVPEVHADAVPGRRRRRRRRHRGRGGHAEGAGDGVTALAVPGPQKQVSNRALKRLKGRNNLRLL